MRTLENLVECCDTGYVITFQPSGNQYPKIFLFKETAEQVAKIVLEKERQNITSEMLEMQKLGYSIPINECYDIEPIDIVIGK